MDSRFRGNDERNTRLAATHPRTKPAQRPHRMNATSLPATAVPESRDHKDARNDRLFRHVLTGTVVFVLVALASAALSMLWGGRHVLAAEGLDFFFTTEWNPVEDQYGALVPIYGTVVTALIAMVIAVP
jgi:phosphate transport system permease protein